MPKINDKIAYKLWQDGHFQKDIAKLFGVSQSAISIAVNRWKRRRGKPEWYVRFQESRRKRLEAKKDEG